MRLKNCFKATVSVVLSIAVLAACFSLSFAGAQEDVPAEAVSPSFARADCLYAHAIQNSDSKEAWQCWEQLDGVNAQKNVYYLFLPKGASDEKIEIYNSYSDSVTVSDTVIQPNTSAVVDYKEGEKTTVTIADTDYSLIIYKSDAAASVYVNDITNSYIDYEGNTVNTDLWSFLTENKENAVAGASCAIVNEDGITDTTLKKIKGRGNMTWREDKKGFNLTFNEKVTVGSITSKKFSMITNSKESTLLRNQIMYDFASDIGSPYTPELNFVDFFVNGAYIGSYSFSPKVDMGKNSLVPFKDNSDTAEENFSFLAEIDVWNYGSDTYFVTDRGFHVVLKTPDLDDYDNNDPLQYSQYNFIKNKFQQLEDAVYGTSLDNLEKICDLNSLAAMYLVNEFGKNCDGGYTSTYFAYNADEDKFYATPVWDFDSTLGNVDCTRDSCKKSTCYFSDWVTKIATYEGIVNPLGQPFNLSGTSSDGKTFEEICKEIWSEKVIPAIKVLNGEQESFGRLQSLDSYKTSNEKTVYINYLKWNYRWFASQNMSGISKSYSKDYSGEFEYLTDWINARANWMTVQYGFEPVAPSVPTYELGDKPNTDTLTIYFANTAKWKNVKYFVWNGTSANSRWPGKNAKLETTLSDGTEIYSATFDSKYDFIIFNDGAKEQTADIPLSNYNYYSVDTENFIENEYSQRIYNVKADMYSLSGDVSGDGQITVSDATLIQKAVAELIKLDEQQQKNADVNGDEKINIKDATLIQMYCAGIITAF